MLFSEADHALVTEAVAAAERTTCGEIVPVVARQSDGYRDIALHWSVLAMLLALALLALWPGFALWVHGRLIDPWAADVPPGEALWIALAVEAAVFVIARLLLAAAPIRMALTPVATKARRVRRRAVALFRVGAEKRTVAATGVLLYVSLAEHRAEIVADAAIASKVSPDVWGEAMAALIGELKAGRPGAGMAAAVERIGAVLAAHFPRADDDVNELPDRLIEL